MIFATAGTQKFPFDRMFSMLDFVLDKEQINEVFAQIGTSSYQPRNYQYVQYLNQEQFNYYMENCDCVVTHSGVGTILNGIRHKKAVIVIPRLKEYKEHIDNHQVEIAHAFSSKGYVIYCNNKEELTNALLNYRQFTPNEYVSQTYNIENIIRNYLHNKM